MESAIKLGLISYKGLLNVQLQSLSLFRILEGVRNSDRE